MIDAAHGGNGIDVATELGIENMLDLSASMNPLPVDVKKIVARHLDAIYFYPNPTKARDALAEAIGVESGRVLLTNGGSEAIALVCAELGSGWVNEPDFSLYKRHLTKLYRGAPLFKSNPHNPTGRLAIDTEKADVWDEAFYPMATGKWTRGDTDSGSIVVGSLTKLFACPGLRIGYIITPDNDLCTKLEQRQPLWSLNSLAAAVLPELLEAVDLPQCASDIALLRRELVDLLKTFGLEPQDSDANFVLVSTGPNSTGPHSTGRTLYDALALLGVLVRDCTNFGLSGCVRIAVPNSNDLLLLEKALNNVVFQ